MDLYATAEGLVARPPLLHFGMTHIVFAAATVYPALRAVRTQLRGFRPNSRRTYSQIFQAT